MTESKNQSPEDEWYDRFLNLSHNYSMELKALCDTNPFEQLNVVERALGDLATELWDRTFGLSEITHALRNAADELPRYAANAEFRP